MSRAVATIPNTAPFSEEDVELLNRVVGPATAVQRAWLAGFLAGVEQAAGNAQAATAPSAEPLTILFASEFGKFREARLRHGEAVAQARLQADTGRHGRSRSDGAQRGEAPGGHRRHLGRGRTARPSGASLRRADGRRRAAPRRRRIRRPGARRHRLRGVLRRRQKNRRTARRARRETRGRAGRLRSRLRRTGRQLDRHRTQSADAAGRRPRPRDRSRLWRQRCGQIQYRHCRGRDHRALEPEFVALGQGDHSPRARLRWRGAGLRAGRFARSLRRKRPGLCRRIAGAGGSNDG